MSHGKPTQLDGYVEFGASRQQQPLPLSGHLLNEVDVQRGAVTRWECIVCGREADDVEEFLEEPCQDLHVH